MPEQLHKLLHAFAALADLGQEFAGTGDFEEMVRSSLHLLLGSLAIRRGAVLEYDTEAHGLRYIGARGIGDDSSGFLDLTADEIDELRHLGLARLKVADDVGSDGLFITRYRSLLDEHRIELILPLTVREKFVGLIMLGDKATGERFTPEECGVVCAMARHIGVGIQERRLLEALEQRAAENLQLYESLRIIYQDTVRAFAAAIDCKDKYTQGHSERVGKYSEIIAREMGWSEEEVEGIAVAGYLHDIGKLVVERDILNAPYRIDAKQSSELNRHPKAGYDILAPIHHPYMDISLTARYHHERPDGRGYPEGLTSEQIPVGAKIVALADSFDAMTTDRPYKRRRELGDVVEDFRRNAGKQFATEVVISFCRALIKELTGETKERRFAKLLGKDYLRADNLAPLLSDLIAELESGAHATAAGNS